MPGLLLYYIIIIIFNTEPDFSLNQGQSPIVINEFTQTSISFNWMWSRSDQLVYYFAIDHAPVIAPVRTPDMVPFWERNYVLDCLMPGKTVNISLAPVIEYDDEYYFGEAGVASRRTSMYKAKIKNKFVSRSRSENLNAKNVCFLFLFF